MTGRLRSVRVLALALCMTVPLSAHAQKKIWRGEQRGYYNPILADPRAAQVNAGVPVWGDGLPFMQTKGRSLMWDIDVGTEIPLIGYETGNSAMSANGVAYGKWGSGFWLAIDFHLLESLADSSMPVLNTDYRFSFMWKNQVGKWKKCWVSLIDCRVGFRAQAGHESTHLGDEYTIGASTSAGFERVNVSYEYWDIGASYEGVKPDGAWGDISDSDDNFILRAGVIGLFRPSVGYYGTDALFPAATTFTRSKNHLEPYVQTQLVKEDLCWWWFKRRQGMGCYLSIDWRLRTQYQYHRASADDAEPMIGSFNITAGYRPQQRAWTGKLNPYLRIYHGVNPHGQFRSMAGWTEFGFGFHVDR